MNLGYYRMYRRLGTTLRVDDSGKTNMLANQMLIVARMRFGGRLGLGGAAAVMNNADVA